VAHTRPPRPANFASVPSVQAMSGMENGGGGTASACDRASAPRGTTARRDTTMSLESTPLANRATELLAKSGVAVVIKRFPRSGFRQEGTDNESARNYKEVLLRKRAARCASVFLGLFRLSGPHILHGKTRRTRKRHATQVLRPHMIYPPLYPPCLYPRIPPYPPCLYSPSSIGLRFISE